MQLEAGKLGSALHIETMDGQLAYPGKNRLTIMDKRSGQKFLIDTGAEISVLPAPRNKRTLPSLQTLVAANNTPINVYGHQRCTVDFGLKRKYQWNFCIADVEQAIIGADFIVHYGILVDLKNKQLTDEKTRKTIIASLDSSKPQEVSSIKYNFTKILNDFPELTGLAPNRMTSHNVKHHIPTKGTPVAEPCRRLAADKYEAVKKEIEFLLAQKMIRPSSSPWASPIHCTKKANGEWRVCGDYRRLNKKTTPDRYSTPHIHDCITNQTHSKKVFSKIDFKRAYHQIPVAPEDIQKTAIITPFGLYEFLVMQFGLCAAAQTFQRFMDEVFRGLDFVIVYIDDILVFSRTPEEHEQHLRMVLERLRKYGLIINVNKCVFGASEMHFLGQKIDANGVSPLPEKVEAVSKFPTPKTIHDVQRFLGMINFYRRFIPHAAMIQAPLCRLTHGSKKKDQTPVNFTEVEARAFDECKRSLAEATLLAHPVPNAKIRLVTDASDLAMGAALEQERGGSWQPLGFFSKKFTSAQKKYSTYDRELTAIFEAIKHFRYTLETREFTIVTDHKPITFAFDQRSDKASPRQARQLDFISQFTTKLEHITGSENIVADTLSRIEMFRIPEEIELEELASEQASDLELTELLKIKNPSFRLTKTTLKGCKKPIYVEISTENRRLYIPKSLRNTVFQIHHRLSHPGGRATLKIMRRQYFWPSMNKNILELARTCLDCQQSKISRHVKTIPNFFEPPEARFAQVHIDLIGPLPESEGYKYCLTCIDRFSRWPEAIPIKDITADTVAKAFYTGWISRFGSPEIICTDQGTQFESELFKSFMQILGCKRNRTTSYHPAANGLIERWHRSLKSSIMCHITEESGNEVFNRWRRTVRDTIQDVARSDWVDILPTVLLGLRTSIRQALDASPAEFLYGTAIRTPGDFIEPRKTPLDTALKTKDAKIFLGAHQDRMNQLLPVPVKYKQKAKSFAYPELENCTHVFLREEDTT